MPGYLTTHVLDTARGCPAAGMRITLYSLSGEGKRALATAVTNADGRTDTPILPQQEFAPGIYELLFHVGDYHAATGQVSGDLPFLDTVPVRFGMAEEAHYHVPLLVSPYSYSTYRGS